MKPIRFTRLARNRMRWHRITDALVEETLRSADWRESSAAGRANRWKRVADRFLRVTCREEAERIVVISAVFKGRPPGERVKP